MPYLMLMFSTGLMIAIWPVNRAVMKKGGRAPNIGLVIGLAGALAAAAAAKMNGETFFHPRAMFYGALAGVAFSLGYCMIIFYCLKIGPSGPTVMMNNLGMVAPVLLNILFFLGGAKPSLFAGAGLLLSLAALILMAFNSGADGGKPSMKWFGWVLLGFFLSCVSMGAQYLAAKSVPNLPYSYAFYCQAVTFLILLGVCAARKSVLPTKIEALAGVFSGTVGVLNAGVLFYLIKNMPGYIVFPVVMVTPIVVMLILGHAVYREKLNRYGVSACAAGLLGIVLLNVVP